MLMHACACRRNSGTSQSITTSRQLLKKGVPDCRASSWQASSMLRMEWTPRRCSLL